MNLFGPMLLLAQDSAPARRTWQSWNMGDSVRLITFIGMLIGAVVIGGILLTYLRRKMIAKESAMAETGSLMEELRRLRKEGVLSESEYEASRRAATAGVRASLGGGGETAGKSGGSPQSSSNGSGKPRPVPRQPPRPPIKPLESQDSGGGLQAKPGFDLTGRTAAASKSEL